jgi:L-alanine-DL-glutamate epimerase-like enolase superfamily enzyme
LKLVGAVRESPLRRPWEVSMRIEKIHLYRLRIPLKQPYKIATAEMKAFDCTIVSLHSQGREGLGEAMADIQGYFWETADQVWQFATGQGPKILGLPVQKGRESISSYAKEKPCAVTPFLTALEMLNPKSLLAPPSEILSVPMLGILQATDPEGIRGEIEDFISQGYETIKIKVGFEVDKDIERVSLAQKIIRGRAHLRADANQGYTLFQAKKFVQSIDPQGIEFLEQPFKENDWNAMVELSRISPLPLGLDESIYGMDSVEKAKKLGCARFVKFKIMKMGSAEALAQAIETSRQMGFDIILGNGAAGEVSCYQEALVAGRMSIRAGEMNGFLKQKESILAQGLKTSGGKIFLAPDYRLRLDLQKVEKFSVDRLILG